MTAVATPATPATPVVRGCGTRYAGACYAVCRLSPNGRPLEDFLLDPPWRIDLDSLGVTDRGVQLLPDLSTGTYHLYDVVGQESYPNVADVIEEGRAHGFSRRLPRTLDWSKVTRQSRLMLIHRRAYVANHGEFYGALGRAGDTHTCPKHNHEHTLRSREMCAGLWWEDLIAGKRAQQGREMARLIGDTPYLARHAPPGVDVLTQRQPAIFLALPLTAIEVVADPATGSHQQTATQAQRAGVPVRVVSS